MFKKQEEEKSICFSKFSLHYWSELESPRGPVLTEIYISHNEQSHPQYFLPRMLQLIGLKRIFPLLLRVSLIALLPLNCLVGRNLCQHCGLNISTSVK